MYCPSGHHVILTAIIKGNEELQGKKSKCDNGNRDCSDCSHQPRNWKNLGKNSPL